MTAPRVGRRQRTSDHPGPAGPNDATKEKKDRVGDPPVDLPVPEPATSIDGFGTTWPIHPLARNLSRMPAAERAALKDSIRRTGGNVDPIIRSQAGEVLDGVTRLELCIELELKPNWKMWDGPPGSEIDVIIDLNARRRQLATSQKALSGARFAGLGRGRPPRNAQICVLSQEEAAKRLGVSKRLVQAAGRVLQQGTPELVTLVEERKVTITAAEWIAGLDRSEQERLVAEGPKAIKEHARALRAETKSRSDQRQFGADGGAAGKGEVTGDADRQPTPGSPPGGPGGDRGGDTGVVGSQAEAGPAPAFHEAEL
jgi:hypothetical protein